MQTARGLDLRHLLAAAEAASPAAAVDAAAAYLADVCGADAVVLWLADAAGQALLSMPDGTRAALNGTDAGDAWRYQRIVESDSIWVPVTVRGDALGVLEIRPRPGDDRAPRLDEELAAA